MTWKGRYLIIQRMVFLVDKADLESMLDESGFGAATKLGGFALDNRPEVSLVP